MNENTELKAGKSSKNKRTEISYLKEELLYHFTKVMNLIDRIEQEQQTKLSKYSSPDKSQADKDNSRDLNFPRMATIDDTVAFLNESAKKVNSVNSLTAFRLRQMALDNEIVHVRAGKKILINIDKLMEFLNNGGEYKTPQKSESESKNNRKYKTVSRIEI